LKARPQQHTSVLLQAEVLRLQERMRVLEGESADQRAPPSVLVHLETRVAALQGDLSHVTLALMESQAECARLARLLEVAQRTNRALQVRPPPCVRLTPCVPKGLSHEGGHKPCVRPCGGMTLATTASAFASASAFAFAYASASASAHSSPARPPALPPALPVPVPQRVSTQSSKFGDFVSLQVRLSAAEAENEDLWRRVGKGRGSTAAQAPCDLSVVRPLTTSAVPVATPAPGPVVWTSAPSPSSAPVLLPPSPLPSPSISPSFGVLVEARDKLAPVLQPLPYNSGSLVAPAPSGARTAPGPGSEQAPGPKTGLATAAAAPRKDSPMVRPRMNWREAL
jgi:hypothetical protein